MPPTLIGMIQDVLTLAPPEMPRPMLPLPFRPGVRPTPGRPLPLPPAVPLPPGGLRFGLAPPPLPFQPMSGVACGCGDLVAATAVAAATTEVATASAKEAAAVSASEESHVAAEAAAAAAPADVATAAVAAAPEADAEEVETSSDESAEAFNDRHRTCLHWCDDTTHECMGDDWDIDDKIDDETSWGTCSCSWSDESAEAFNDRHRNRPHWCDDRWIYFPSPSKCRRYVPSKRRRRR